MEKVIQLLILSFFLTFCCYEFGFRRRRRGADDQRIKTNKFFVKFPSQNENLNNFFQQSFSEMSYYKKLLPDSRRRYYISWKTTEILSRVILTWVVDIDTNSIRYWKKTLKLHSSYYFKLYLDSTCSQILDCMCKI